MTNRVIPFGYSTPGASQTLETLMADPDMLLIDIRKVPFSRWQYQWNRHSLSRQYDARYLYLGDYLGNLNYKPEDRHKGIRLSNALVGVDQLLAVMQDHHTILLCACKEYEQCHRKVVAELVKQVMPEVEIVLEVPA